MSIHRRLVMTAAAVLACAAAGGGLAVAQGGLSGNSRQCRHSLRSHGRRSGARLHRVRSCSGSASLRSRGHRHRSDSGARSRGRRHHSGSGSEARGRGHHHGSGLRSRRIGVDRMHRGRGERRRRRCDSDDPLRDRDDAFRRDDTIRGGDCREAESGEAENVETEATVEAPSSVATEVANFAG